MVLIASATSKTIVSSALRARECESRFGCTPSRPFLGGQRAPANFGAPSHAASGNTPARHAGLSVLRRPAAGLAETRRKSRCTSAFALGNGTSALFKCLRSGNSAST